MQIQAPAKLNLTLEVLGPRPDGYHETASIMQTLDLADAITVEHSDALAVTCSNPSLNGDANLAMRAADLLRREAGDPTAGARIRIEKRIPIAAGLGGGSSDAAATLNALNRPLEPKPIQRQAARHSRQARLRRAVSHRRRNRHSARQGRARPPHSDAAQSAVIRPSLPKIGYARQDRDDVPRANPAKLHARRLDAQAGSPHTRRGRRPAPTPIQRLRRCSPRRHPRSRALLGRPPRRRRPRNPPSRKRPNHLRRHRPQRDSHHHPPSHEPHQRLAVHSGESRKCPFPLEMNAPKSLPP